MKAISFILLFSVIGVRSYAQEDVVQPSKNTVSLEVLGAGGYYSLNYQRTVVNKERRDIGLRGGIAVYHLRDFQRKFNPDFILPVAVTMHWGEKHQLEMVLGQSLGFIVVLAPDMEKERDTSASLFGEIGYRYHKTGGRFMWRIYYNPYVLRYQELRHWYGLGFGISF